MFELTTPTTARVKSATPRGEHHGEDLVVAITLRLQITGPNTLLDVLSSTLRHGLYMAVPGQEQLPGVEPATPLLRTKDITKADVAGSFEGWTMKVDHGIHGDEEPITMSGCKVDKFKLDEIMEGGTVKWSFNVGSNDLNDDELGILCGKLGSEITFTLHAPEKPAEAINGTKAAFEADHPDATGLFAAGADGPDEDEAPDDSEGGDPDISGSREAWPFPKGDKPTEAPPQSATTEVVIERSQPGTRTARGREKTAAALAAGAKS